MRRYLRAALIVSLTLSACREPTEVRVELDTDAKCSDVIGTTITTGELEGLELRPPATATSKCDIATGRIGSLVIIPEAEKDGDFAIRIVTGFYKTPEECVEDGYVGGCIVARRALSFIPHTPIELPITLEAACIDVPCEATQTCRRGTCVDAHLPDPTHCTDPLGCEPGGEAGAGGAPDSGGSSAGGSVAGGAGGESGSPPLVEAGSPSNGAEGGAGGAAPEPQPALHAIAVTTVADVLDGNVKNLAALVAEPGADVAISLREAIVAANATPNDGGPDQIAFALEGAAPFTIAVSGEPLPDVVDPLMIDGTSQPGYTGQPLIELVGDALATGNGLSFVAGSDGSRLKALAIGGFPDSGVLLSGSNQHVLEVSYLGLAADGLKRRGNGVGLRLADSADNTIGGELPMTGKGGNVISANGTQGVLLTGQGSQRNVICGNLIGLDASGTLARGNSLNGVMLTSGASYNVIGTADSLTRNVLSANGGNGLRITDAGTHDNVVQGNLIGSDVTFSAVSSLGNGWAGIRINDGAHDNLVGGDDVSLGNRIWFNALSGVAIVGNLSSPRNNAILSNWIGSNGGIGIDLGSDGGVTPNDAGDVDSGANDVLNFPSFTGASYAAGEVALSYSLDVPAGSYRVEFFTADGDASGYGEGEFPATAVTVTHDGKGPKAYQVSLTCGQSALITATTTALDPGGGYDSTSEFSLAIPTTYP